MHRSDYRGDTYPTRLLNLALTSSRSKHALWHDKNLCLRAIATAQKSVICASFYVFVDAVRNAGEGKGRWKGTVGWGGHTRGFNPITLM